MNNNIIRISHIQNNLLPNESVYTQKRNNITQNPSRNEHIQHYDIKNTNNKILSHNLNIQPPSTQMDLSKINPDELFKFIAEQQSQMLQPYFETALERLKSSTINDENINSYFAIISNYSISNPLNVSQETLDRMTIYEETIFNEVNEKVKQLALNALSTTMLLKYFSLEHLKEKAKQIIYSEEPSSNKEEVFWDSERDATEQTLPKKEINMLSQKMMSLIKEIKENRDKLETIHYEDEKHLKIVLGRLKKLHTDLSENLKKSFIEAYIKSPTTKEQEIFVNMINALSENHLISEILYSFYNRISLPTLNNREQILLIKCMEQNSKEKPLGEIKIDFTKDTTSSFLKRYKGYKQKAMSNYMNSLIEERRKDITNNQSKVNIGYEKSDALFFAMEAAGFSAKELETMEALVAFENSSSDFKEEVLKNLNNFEEWFLKEISKNYKIMYSSDWDNLSTKSKMEIKAKQYDLIAIYKALSNDPPELLDYKISLALNPETAKYITSIAERAYLTPENYDDFEINKVLIKLNELSKGTFDLTDTVVSYIQTMKMLGKDVDKKFLSKVLGLDKESDNFFNEINIALSDCFAYSSLEKESEEKKYLNQAKTKLFNILGNYIENKIKQNLNKDPKFLGSDEAFEHISKISTVIKILLGTKIVTEEEIKNFFSQYPLIESKKEKFSLKDLNNQPVYTEGIEYLPREVYDILSMDPTSVELLKNNERFLNIYWVPFEKNKKGFSGFATIYKNSILIIYQEDFRKNYSPQELAVTLLHEIQHKIDYEKIDNYNKKLDANSRTYFLPPLIAEYNAILRQTKFLENNKIKEYWEKQDFKKYKLYREHSNTITSIAKRLLNLSDDFIDFLEPPYDNVKLDSLSMIIDPQFIDKKSFDTINQTLNQLGYTGPEKDWLLDRILLILKGMYIDLASMELGERNLFFDFIKKLTKFNIPDRIDTKTIKFFVEHKKYLINYYKDLMTYVKTNNVFTEEMRQNYLELLNETTQLPLTTIDRFLLNEFFVTNSSYF